MAKDDPEMEMETDDETEDIVARMEGQPSLRDLVYQVLRRLDQLEAAMSRPPRYQAPYSAPPMAPPMFPNYTWNDSTNTWRGDYDVYNTGVSAPRSKSKKRRFRMSIG